MFRDKKASDISPKNFGAGSRVEGAPGRSWLVICNDERVGLVDLQGFVLVDGSIPAGDPNYLTEDEARQLVELVDDGCSTFSDYTLHPQGIKGLKFVANDGPIQ